MKKKKWTDPVKDKPPKAATLDTKGNFRDFTELMRRIVHKPAGGSKPSASRVPGAS